MKRFLIATFLLVWATSPIAAQEEAVKCPAKLETIEDCPLTGCSGSKIDPRLNAQKNIRKDNHAATDKDFADLAALPDPVLGFAVGNSREKLAALGEGQIIRVVAFALVARKGGKESCNCGLKRAADTDNHIVLVDEPTLKLTARALSKNPRLPHNSSIRLKSVFLWIL